MKQLLAFLVLLVHMNFFMFMPQANEVDQYSSNGVEVDDINSFAEYIDQIVLGNKDCTPEDEDDDSARNFQLIQTDLFSFIQQFVEFNNPYNNLKKNNFPPFIEQRFTSIYYDIQAPPPRV
ncbi:hypothetical protein OCK74_09330 [Chitinophagaceae bacterium LB-8]|uniref:Uncharacterized protein n=1 Tax=Paraflavisolibacter caeni TaxID=2982496 RepID=A0A9X2XVG6_9BACT|nr:hypothetical protein [Paraflavisolibacter caeni]MCU7549316.1 hypothetical protein [Paraflavisolibacter caeni]